jgi:hypothetical protein
MLSINELAIGVKKKENRERLRMRKEQKNCGGGRRGNLYMTIRIHFTI